VKAFLGGVAATFAAIGIAGYLAAVEGLIPANADAKPSKAERWFATTALKAVVLRRAPTQSNPVAPADENVIAGIRLYKQNCAVCHGEADARPSNIANGLYQRPPQFAKHGVEDDPAGQTYWKIAHGIRLTGMPAFSKTLNDTQKWQITLFLQRMDRLSPAAQVAWKSASKAP
jgi:mono/diheme cytochrome c family protein